jgi:hypothetical protein
VADSEVLEKSAGSGSRSSVVKHEVTYAVESISRSAFCATFRGFWPKDLPIGPTRRAIVLVLRIKTAGISDHRRAVELIIRLVSPGPDVAAGVARKRAFGNRIAFGS